MMHMDHIMVFDDPKVFDYPQVIVNLKVILDENISIVMVQKNSMNLI